MLGAATLILAVLRLAFVRGLLLPQYFDSAAHYRLIRSLVEVAGGVASSSSIAIPSVNYYHLGYHVLLAGVVSITGLPLSSLMLIFGQLMLALTPLSVYAFAHRASGSAPAALLAVVLAAIGWYMPAFAANWGKYPALLSLLPSVGALALTWTAERGVVEVGAAPAALDLEWR